MRRTTSFVTLAALSVVFLTGCNNSVKDQNAALIEENQQLRAQLEQANSERLAAEERASRQVEIARAAEQRAQQAATEAARQQPVNQPALGYTPPAANRPATTNRSVASASGASLPTTHVVKEGETLSHIALKYYKNAGLWQPIYDANKAVIGPNANRVRAGMKLTIPAR